MRYPPYEDFSTMNHIVKKLLHRGCISTKLKTPKFGREVT